MAPSWLLRLSGSTSNAFQSLFNSTPKSNLAVSSDMSRSSSSANRTAPQDDEASRSHSHKDSPIWMSDQSTPAIPNSLFSSNDFMLGSGMVIIQPSSKKIVVVYDSHHDYWFLPKGRKDKGESLEQAALRESFEESGYKPRFLPLYSPSNQPSAPNPEHDTHDIPHTEPIFISTTYWPPRRWQQNRPGDSGGVYLTFWYVGQIAEDAVRELDTGMDNEKHYQPHLLDYDDAYDKLKRTCEGLVVQTAYRLWNHSVEELSNPNEDASTPVYSWEQGGRTSHYSPDVKD